jgi:hypothetical protein
MYFSFIRGFLQTLFASGRCQVEVVALISADIHERPGRRCRTAFLCDMVHLMKLVSALLVAGILATTMYAAAAETNALPDRAALEAKFKEQLAGCTFNGRWCLVKDGVLGEERQEKYSIEGATKSGGDVWLIYARIQYGNKDVKIPVPVQVRWAGDTPVITLDNVSLPGLGTYSARVLVYDKTYAGTWSAGDHGGMLHGVIEKPKP